MKLIAGLFVAGLVLAGEFPVGSKMPAITAGGHTVKTASGRATAVLFVSTECPVSNAYNERMKAIYNDYSGKGVQFAFVNANDHETPDVIAKHAKENFPFTVHKDQNNVLADKLNAQYTPEVFLFDKAGTLVYHGRIDDSRELDKVSSKDFRAALDATLAGKPVPAPDTKAFGCTIKRAKKTS